MGRVISINPDPKGIIQNVHVKVAPNRCIKVKSSNVIDPGSKENFERTILHQDVLRLVVLIPVEDQPNLEVRSSCDAQKDQVGGVAATGRESRQSDGGVAAATLLVKWKQVCELCANE